MEIHYTLRPFLIKAARPRSMRSGSKRPAEQDIEILSRRPEILTQAGTSSFMSPFLGLMLLCAIQSLGLETFKIWNVII